MAEEDTVLDQGMAGGLLMNEDFLTNVRAMDEEDAIQLIKSLGYADMAEFEAAALSVATTAESEVLSRAPQGRMVRNNIYTAANPLEHLGQALRVGKAGQEARTRQGNLDKMQKEWGEKTPQAVYSAIMAQALRGNTGATAASENANVGGTPPPAAPAPPGAAGAGPAAPNMPPSQGIGGGTGSPRSMGPNLQNPEDFSMYRYQYGLENPDEVVRTGVVGETPQESWVPELEKAKAEILRRKRMSGTNVVTDPYNMDFIAP